MEYICIRMYLEHYSIMKAFFCHFGKTLSFFAFDAFCVVLAHKKAFSVTTNKEA
ncbi:hypothetical protein [Helicobacter pylori]|uniref:hypothetical protein n=1 Tax=Helicobacter pylori TaxID=210 RepID=UPI0012FECABA|nr:hypothetical protein [Helicobacter pylori]WRE43974.1 hypothetical protein KVE65_01415 [Helicobacter pylori]